MAETDEEDIFDDDVLRAVRDRRVGVAERRTGNHKEVHYHNGSNKIVWAWACGVTSLFVAIVGGVAMLFFSAQTRTNESVADALTDVKVELSSVKTQVDGLERQVERLADQKP